MSGIRVKRTMSKLTHFIDYYVGHERKVETYLLYMNK